MEDSFFGFDTSIPYDEDGGGQIEEPSEEEYDALNNETFGSAINTDWEEAHENMVRLDDNIGDGDIIVQHGRMLHNSKNFDYDDKLRDSSNTSSRGSTSPTLLNRAQHSFPNAADSDLELNLANMKLEEVDFHFNDSTHSSADLGGITLDPSVWSTLPMHPSRSLNNFGNNNVLFSARTNGLNMSFSRNIDEQLYSHKMQQPIVGLPKPLSASGISTLEDIERNLILGQTMQKQKHQQEMKLPSSFQQQTHVEQLKSQQSQLKGTSQSPSRPSSSLMGVTPQQQQTTSSSMLHQQQQQLANNARLPPGFPPMYPPGFGPHLPPGAAQPGNHNHHPQLPIHHPLLSQHGGLTMNFQHPMSRPQLPIPINNFAMRPTYSPMRVSATAMNILGNQATQINVTPNQQHQMNLLNMRMMQEIQQNHPMLQQQRGILPQLQQYSHHHPHQNEHQLHMQQEQHRHMLMKQHHLQMQQQQQHQQQLHNQQQQNHRHNNNRANGNLREFDEYANLMSTRDKHWLIGIQLTQLNVDTPYIDDFYYTVYKQRQSEMKGEFRNSQAHKDNQLNHPLIQPRGHAQLILVQLGNKNGTRNGQHRERRNSDVNTQNNNNNNNSHSNSSNNNNSYSNNKEQQDKSQYVFAPMKFENSLGKLQYCSVTAPRKIIDAEIMGSEGTQQNNGSVTVRPKTPAITSLGAANYILAGSSGGNVTLTLMQHKTRDLLLHIETLFRIVLKLEDLKNPAALQSIALKKKKETERLANMEQQENAHKIAEDISADVTVSVEDNIQTKTKFYYEIEPEEDLLETLMSGLTMAKVVAIMNVRKGKILIRRLLPFITDNNLRWNLWIGIFQALQSVVKKDREDSEGTLYALYPEFKKQIGLANFETVMRFVSALSLNDKRSDNIFCSRFGISALVCLIARVEQIYQLNDADKTNNILDSKHMQQWSEFLNQVANSLNRTIQNQTICAAIESDSIEPLMNHVKRLKELKLDALLALIDKAKNQIN